MFARGDGTPRAQLESFFDDIKNNSYIVQKPHQNHQKTTNFRLLHKRKIRLY